ncbi:MAG: CPBP family intramembrane metalloprotease [Coprothermobacterota bacterium]|nr:CPBP family intramembrane metalloprotease [Coprothermobacterota bacterium]
MSDNIASNNPGKQEPMKETPASTSLAVRSGLFVLFLICSLAIFLFGANYYKLFPTNGNILYAASLSAVFLIAAALFKRSEKFGKYWQNAYAFFVASAVNLVSALFAGYFSAIAQSLGLSMDTSQGSALGKLYDALLVVIPILVLTKFSGADLGSLFLKKGNKNNKWGLGIGALVLINLLTSAFIFFGAGYDPAKLGAAIVWGAVFAFSNSFLEELWLRGLFLKKLVPIIGVAGTVLLTSVWFASLHFLGVSYLPTTVIPIFLVNTFTLGLACSILMLKTDSIWGAFLIHAGADLFLFIAVLAAR